jgi:hypothetical protein
VLHDAVLEAAGLERPVEVERVLWAYPSGLRQLKAKPFESTPTRGDDEREE